MQKEAQTRHQQSQVWGASGFPSVLCAQRVPRTCAASLRNTNETPGGHHGPAFANIKGFSKHCTEERHLRLPWALTWQLLEGLNPKEGLKDREAERKTSLTLYPLLQCRQVICNFSFQFIDFKRSRNKKKKKKTKHNP
jgi:hypothetical protein